MCAKGAPVTQATVVAGWQPLTWAAARGHMDVCKALIAADADVTFQDGEGHSAAQLTEDKEVKAFLYGLEKAARDAKRAAKAAAAGETKKESKEEEAAPAAEEAPAEEAKAEEPAAEPAAEEPAAEPAAEEAKAEEPAAEAEAATE